MRDDRMNTTPILAACAALSGVALCLLQLATAAIK